MLRMLRPIQRHNKDSKMLTSYSYALPHAWMGLIPSNLWKIPHAGKDTVHDIIMLLNDCSARLLCTNITSLHPLSGFHTLHRNRWQPRSLSTDTALVHDRLAHALAHYTSANNHSCSSHFETTSAFFWLLFTDLHLHLRRFGYLVFGSLDFCLSFSWTSFLSVHYDSFGPVDAGVSSLLWLSSACFSLWTLRFWCIY